MLELGPFDFFFLVKRKQGISTDACSGSSLPFWSRSSAHFHLQPVLRSRPTCLLLCDGDRDGDNTCALSPASGRQLSLGSAHFTLALQGRAASGKSLPGLRAAPGAARGSGVDCVLSHTAFSLRVFLTASPHISALTLGLCVSSRLQHGMC